MKRTTRALGALSFAALSIASAPLAAQDELFGEWVELFNGKDLAGWQNAKPHDGHHKGPNRWFVDEGALTNPDPKETGTRANDICTVDEFEDYELEIEYRINEKGNSGVYLRGQIEIQIFDSCPGGTPKPDDQLKSIDAGAIYGGDFPALTNAQLPPGKWNKYRVLHIGDRITVWHNGKLIQDNIAQNVGTGGKMTHYPASYPLPLDCHRGPLMLQGDHEKVWYRNIRIRPLFGAGWRPLWNGEDMSEFNADRQEGHKKRAANGLLWDVKDGAFTNRGIGEHGHDIWTNESFGNFLAYYAYKPDITEGGDGNSGFYLRDQWEIQINARQSTENPHTDGSLYSIRSPSVHASNGPNRWNHMFVKVVGQKITVWQNGQKLHTDIVLPRRTDADEPTPDFSYGPFKLQGDHAKVWFTNLYIKPLSDYAE